ncbi:MAG TPA: DUF488 domain-containing protein [Verrucomicrobiae bacterium]
MIQVKRVYEPVAKTDGKRFLVDRLWPRGVKKEALHLEAWLKESAPSDNLRRWFKHEPAKWKEFQKRYRGELTKHPQHFQLLIEAATNGSLTLLFGAHDTEHNNAVVLRDFLNEQIQPSKKT